ncbi:hypothetical protein D0S48_12460 [Psychrobacillus sp. AK 1817]|nr:hypothetical protein D0S48_12460 [Psychrobacillus sp. AK 1817]QGM31926.1 hypothetical protein GI482_16900 [Bacillus sp. N3536]
MGLKYIEPVKSIILLILILLSLTLTFTIWTYSPNYPETDTPVVDISIAEKKKMEEVVRPYRLLISQPDNLKGSNSLVDINSVINSMKNWEIGTVKLFSNNTNVQQVNELINQPYASTLFFQADVPIESYGSILKFVDPIFPNTSFNRLVIDWNSSDAEGTEGEKNSSQGLTLYFISTTQNKIYSADVSKEDINSFSEHMIKTANAMQVYTEIARGGKYSIFTTGNPEKIVQYSYLIEDIDINRFKDALFNIPSLVVRRSNPVGSGEQYTDDNALMTVDPMSMRLNYVLPSAEGQFLGKSSELLYNSLSFVNEHDGWTDDFRFSRMNKESNQVNFQLYFEGLPVFSHIMSTEIMQSWGSNRVYRYNRPYFTLNDQPFSSKDIELLSGREAYELLSLVPNQQVSMIEEMVQGYYLSRDADQPLFTLVPSWYYLVNGVWIRLSPEDLGGGTFGLE